MDFEFSKYHLFILKLGFYKLKYVSYIPFFPCCNETEAVFQTMLVAKDTIPLLSDHKPVL